MLILVSLMLWFNISVLLHYDVASFVNFFLFFRNIKTIPSENLKIRAYNDSTLVTQEKLKVRNKHNIQFLIIMMSPFFAWTDKIIFLSKQLLLPIFSFFPYCYKFFTLFLDKRFRIRQIISRRCFEIWTIKLFLNI